MATGETWPPIVARNRVVEGGAPAMSSIAEQTLAKRSLTVAAHRTSISLEDAFWTGLRDIAALRGMTAAALVAEIDRNRGGANLSSAIRVFVLAFYRERAAVGMAGPDRCSIGAAPQKST